MSNFKEKAIEICKNSPFGVTPPPSVVLADGQGKTDEKLSSCDNHLDAEFMKLLDQGAHLDTDKVPL
ncbi:MAG: hypothetical protein AAB508_06210 [Patescibacteria group bacterium]